MPSSGMGSPSCGGPCSGMACFRSMLCSAAHANTIGQALNEKRKLTNNLLLYLFKVAYLMAPFPAGIADKHNKRPLSTQRWTLSARGPSCLPSPVL